VYLKRSAASLSPAGENIEVCKSLARSVSQFSAGHASAWVNLPENLSTPDFCSNMLANLLKLQQEKDRPSMTSLSTMSSAPQFRSA
jgi:hypothetical protein